MWFRGAGVALLATFASGCTLQEAPEQTSGPSAGGAIQAGPAAAFQLVSDAFVHNGIIPVRYTGDGDDVSPPLAWTGAPSATESFVVTVVDPDVPWGEDVPVYGVLPPPGTQPGDLFIHWMAVDIPATVTSLADAASPGAMPAGARELRTSFALFDVPANRYGGPAPPPELKAHEYVFTVYALDVPTLEGLTAESDYAALTEAMAGHVLGTASLRGFFGH